MPRSARAASKSVARTTPLAAAAAAAEPAAVELAARGSDGGAIAATAIATFAAAFGARIRLVEVDTVAKWHLTDKYKAAAGQYDIHETALWKGKRKNDWRIIGPKNVTFPQPKGWTLKGGTETNHDNFRINVITKFITMQKFEPPTSTEQEWIYTVDIHND